MKVIKKSSAKNVGWKKRVVCTGAGNGGYGCKSVLEIQESDIYHTHHYDYGGGHDVYTTIQCPLCKKETDVKDVPYVSYPDKDVWMKRQK